MNESAVTIIGLLALAIASGMLGRAFVGGHHHRGSGRCSPFTGDGSHC